ncbi:MAG: cytochrome c [Rhodospirillales bacterium]|nr:MAG: cytochrome c [Rhodospirillales bacterium]
MVVSAAAALALWRFAGAGSEVGFASEYIDSEDRGLVALGSEVYTAHCAACHGADLEGEANWRRRKADGTLPAPPHDQTGHTWHHADALLFEITKFGGQAMAPAGYRSGMPAFQGVLDDREIVASIAFIKSRWPDDIRQRQTEITRASR